MAIEYNISDEIPLDLSLSIANSVFEPTGNAYDVSLDNIPFLLKADTNNPYRRTTAAYKKDQYDSSTEPGEYSLTGWWIRSQTSWHNGSGIEFYEPGLDYQHTSHRFKDSRGVDVWTIGEMTALPELFHAYSGANLLNAVEAYDSTLSAECLISGDSAGALHKVRLNGDSNVTGTAYDTTYTIASHTSYPFYSVAFDGVNYWAVCKNGIHKGAVASNADSFFAAHAKPTDTGKLLIKYAKGFLFFADGETLWLVDTAFGPSGTHASATSFTTSGSTAAIDWRKHLSTNWTWTDIVGGASKIYAAGFSGNRSEIWKINFNSGVEAAGTYQNQLTPDLAGMTVAVELPIGEKVKSLKHYLGYLAVGTNKGVRICNIDANGDVILGPLLVESSYEINGFAAKDTYLYAATKLDEGVYTHGAVIRIDLSQQFDDGTFAYANDLEYRSSVNVDNETGFVATSSSANEVYLIDGRICLVIEENGTGELQVEHSTNKRNQSWLQTGYVRYGTVEHKYFKTIEVNGDISPEDTIQIYSVDANGNEYQVIVLDENSVGSSLNINQPSNSQEILSFKFVLINSTPVTNMPKLKSYQIKSIPAVNRQRLYEFPLSCYDFEMDRFNSQFGYKGRAWDVINTLEDLERTGNFVRVKDYRTEESFNGLIEEVQFTNTASPDKDNNGYGGILNVVIRKM